MSEPAGKPSPSTPPKPPTGEPRRMNFNSMTLILLAVAAVITVIAWSSSPANYGTTVPYSYFYDQLQKNDVNSVTFQ